MARFLASLLLSLLAAAVWAQPQASSSHSAPKVKSPVPDSGASSQGVYRNSAFGFSYKLPFGWVDRTAEMQDDSAPAFESRLLLATFERPPEASGETINSAVVIAVEPLPAGMKTDTDYFESLAELTTAKGFQAANEAHELSVGTTKLVRGDFSKPRGTLTMRQTSLVMVQRSYAISFTFIAGSEEEVNELVERLSFTPRKPTR
ncbi:MAG: hypothetical protein WA637_21840 [Terriglobales bacterium]